MYQAQIPRSKILTESRHRRIFKPIYQYCNFSEVMCISEIGGYFLNSNLKLVCTFTSYKVKNYRRITELGTIEGMN